VSAANNFLLYTIRCCCCCCVMYNNKEYIPRAHGATWNRELDYIWKERALPSPFSFKFSFFLYSRRVESLTSSVSARPRRRRHTAQRDAKLCG
jgi:hypothetical protein